VGCVQKKKAKERKQAYKTSTRSGKYWEGWGKPSWAQKRKGGVRKSAPNPGKKEEENLKVQMGPREQKRNASEKKKRRKKKYPRGSCCGGKVGHKKKKEGGTPRV